MLCAAAAATVVKSLQLSSAFLISRKSENRQMMFIPSKSGWAWG